MTDFKEQARAMAVSLGRDYPDVVERIATALSEVHEAGRREEREECANRVLTAWEALPGGEQFVWRVQGWLENDMARMINSFRADLAAIRSRELKP